MAGIRARFQTPAHLKVICRKCTRESRIRGNSEEQANRIAKALGWRETKLGLVCPKCPGGGKPDVEALEIEFAAMQAQPA
jgi:hypothetical protein